MYTPLLEWQQITTAGFGKVLDSRWLAKSPNYGSGLHKDRPVKAAPKPSARFRQYPPASKPVVSSLHRSLCLLISVFAITMRIGEATTPGPALGPVLGNINPTGLMGKSNDVAQLPVGVYAVQETHLTGPGITKFRQELAWRKSQYNLCHGAPAPPKTAPCAQ